MKKPVNYNMLETHDLVFEEYVDGEGELRVHVKHSDSSFWIKRGEVGSIIAHLRRVFSLYAD